MTWPTSLPLPLIKRKYDLDPRNASTIMETGRMRNRRVYDIPVKMIQVAWNFTQDEFDTFKSFFDTDLENGTLTFDWDEEGTLAFYPATYDFTRTDNLFAVSATLEVVVAYNSTPELPDITVIYEDETDSNGIPITEGNCRSYFSLQWDFTGRDEPGIIQTALTDSGPWFDYITPVPTPEQSATKIMKVDINNQFNATRYFRVFHGGLPVTKTVNPLASVVPFPDWSVTNLSVVRDLPAISAENGIFVPYSNLENGLISATSIYVEPVARLEYNDTTSPGTQIVDVANVPDGGTWKWAVNGADPTITTKIPRFNGIDNNLACKRDEFAMVLRIRCFSGECKSPVALIAIDKRFPLQPIIVTKATFGPGTFVAGVCDLPKGDVLSGYDCSLWGGAGALTELTMSLACGNSTPTLSSGHDILYHKTDTYTAGPDSFGFMSHHAIATRYRADSIQEIARYPHWDDIPSVCEYLEQSTNVAVESHFELLTTPISGGGLAGTGGSFSLSEAAAANYIYSVVSGYSCTDDAFVQVTFTQWDYLFSIINEVGDLPLADPPPDPLVDDTVYGDNFEEYDDSADASSISLAAGSGFTAAWVLNSAPIIEGFDFWTDTGFTADDYNGGSGWGTDWTITSGSDYYDDFEDYDDADPAPEQENLHSGSGWALNDDGYQHGWVFTPPLGGLETFESYTDSSDATGVDMGGGSGWTLVDWTLHEQNYADSFESYSDDSDVTTSDAMNGGTGWNSSWTIN